MAQGSQTSFESKRAALAEAQILAHGVVHGTACGGKGIGDEAEGLLDEFRGVREPGKVQPGDVIVGLPPDDPNSAALAQKLDGAGFDAGTEDSSVEASTKNRTSVIRFGLRGIEAARVLASHLDGNVAYEFSTELPGRRLELIPGPSAPQVRSTPLPLSSVPTPTIPDTRAGRGTTTTSSSTTTSTTAAPGMTTTTVVSGATPSTLQEDVTTTTAIGVVTLNAKAAAQCDG